uniref:Major facilitator superfamily (MFS) profile domain-containing protein n=1 Tax=Podarcis muralis TaxID=64176 RepID=A0A670JZH5_PODMU
MITYTSVHVKTFINESWLERSGMPVHPESLTLFWASIVSIFSLGGLLGTMASGYFTTKFGKKKCLLGTNLIMLSGAVIMGFSKVANSFELILAGRFLCGISTSICVLLHPQYVGEISPKKLRGFANSTASIFWSLGKVLGQVMGQREFLGNASLWPLLLASHGVTALLQLLTLPFFPESPPHLFLSKGDEEGCRKAMKTLWGRGPHQVELDDLRKQQSALWSTKSVLEVMKDPALRRQLYILFLLAVTLQLTGIHTIYSYTFEVLQTVGFDDDHIPALSLGISLSELLSAVFCSVIIERFGRRVLLWGGYGLMATVLAAVTLTISLQHSSSWMPYCSLALIFCFVICFGAGPAGAGASVRMEIFDQSSRSSSLRDQWILKLDRILLDRNGVSICRGTHSSVQLPHLHWALSTFPQSLFTSSCRRPRGNRSSKSEKSLINSNFKKKQALGSENEIHRRPCALHQAMMEPSGIRRSEELCR